MANNNLLASDNFGSGSLAAGWAVIPTQSFSQIAGSPFVAEPPSTATPGRQMWTGLTWPNDQISEITVASITSENGTQAELWVRVQSGTYSGYVVTITNNTVDFYRNDAGTFTKLGSTVSGLTFSVNDVWTFSAAGSTLVLYQNYKQIKRWMDATYTSGSPGFGEQSTVNVTHVKIGSWRGYSTIQQDGVWQKQNIVLAPLAGDISSGGGGVANATMLYEGNAQILSGTVYKMWFSAGSPAAESNVYYAESSDGKTWSRYGSAVISGQGSPFIIKNGLTYYLYTQPNGSNGVGNFSVYTSTDGINWTVQATNILGALGGAGVWDGVVQWYFQPVAIIAGTWYGVYSGSNSSVTSLLKIGLATSADGITWSKSASNPVLSAANGAAVVNSSALANINGTYYMWMFGVQPGRGGTPTLQNPGEGVLYSTTDFITWTLVHHSVHQSQIYEGVNFVAGQSYPNSIFTVGNQTYMYIQAAVNDGGAQSEYQLSLAIAPAPISALVTQNEDGVQQIAADNFNRASGGLGANWTTPTGGTALQIASNLCEGTALSPCIAAYTAATFSNDHYAECTLQTMGAGSGISPIVRCQTGSVGYYVCGNVGPFNSAQVTLNIYKNVNGVFTALAGSGVTLTAQANDVIRLSVVGNVLSLFQNGFLVMQVQDVNNTFTTGFPGLYINPFTSVTTAQVPLWAGGNAGVLPSYPSDVSGNAGVAGAKVSYSGAASGSVTADGLGNFVIHNLAAGSYTITPSLTAHQFSPISRAVVVTGSGAAITGVNFTTKILSGGLSFDFRFRF